MTKCYENWIGMMDSGVGGISVLKRAIDLMPNENFVYFGDSANAPYGERSPEWIRERTAKIVDDLIGEGVKAVVIACNTATSAAADYIREQHPDFPIIGLEPALKQAVVFPETHHVLVMATPVTIHLSKYQELYNRWGKNAGASSVVCEGLAARIEQGNLDAPDMHQLLENLVGKYRGVADSVVLGCTHYPFVAKQIKDVLGDVPLFDGAFGTARYLARVLNERGIANVATPAADATKPAAESPIANTATTLAVHGKVELYSSIDTPKERALYDWFFSQPLDTSEFIQ